MFVKGEEITYQDMEGVIAFIGSSYIVMELPPYPGLNSARVLIFRENFKNVIHKNYTSK